MRKIWMNKLHERLSLFFHTHWTSKGCSKVHCTMVSNDSTIANNKTWINKAFSSSQSVDVILKLFLNLLKILQKNYNECEFTTISWVHVVGSLKYKCLNFLDATMCGTFIRIKRFIFIFIILWPTNFHP
jgi:hypothetical protein